MKTWDKSYISGPDMFFKYDMHIKQDYEISNMILRMIIRQTSLLLLSIPISLLFSNHPG